MDHDAVEIAAELHRLYSVSLKPLWITTCTAALRAAVPDAATWPRQRLLEAIFAQALCTDLSTCGAACLPPTLQTYHKQLLTGKYVLQVDEVVNMAAAARDRYNNNVRDRCLKLHLSDGSQHVNGIEYRPLPSVHWDCPAGCKVVVENVMCRRGVLLLQPENCAVLGGKVDALEAARLRAVTCWNKPPEGRPAHMGPRDVFVEARAAAWQQQEQQNEQQQMQPPAQPAQQQQQQQHPAQPAQPAQQDPVQQQQQQPPQQQWHQPPPPQQQQQQQQQQQSVWPGNEPAVNRPDVHIPVQAPPHPQQQYQQAPWQSVRLPEQQQQQRQQQQQMPQPAYQSWQPQQQPPQPPAQFQAQEPHPPSHPQQAPSEPSQQQGTHTERRPWQQPQMASLQPSGPHQHPQQHPQHSPWQSSETFLSANAPHPNPHTTNQNHNTNTNSFSAVFAPPTYPSSSMQQQQPSHQPNTMRPPTPPSTTVIWPPTTDNISTLPARPQPALPTPSSTSRPAPSPALPSYTPLQPRENQLASGPRPSMPALSQSGVYSLHTHHTSATGAPAAVDGISHGYHPSSSSHGGEVEGVSMGMGSKVQGDMSKVQGRMVGTSLLARVPEHLWASAGMRPPVDAGAVNASGGVGAGGGGVGGGSVASGYLALRQKRPDVGIQMQPQQQVVSAQPGSVGQGNTVQPMVIDLISDEDEDEVRVDVNASVSGGGGHVNGYAGIDQPRVQTGPGSMSWEQPAAQPWEQPQHRPQEQPQQHQQPLNQRHQSVQAVQGHQAVQQHQAVQGQYHAVRSDPSVHHAIQTDHQYLDDNHPWEEEHHLGGRDGLDISGGGPMPTPVQASASHQGFAQPPPAAPETALNTALEEERMWEDPPLVFLSSLAVGSPPVDLGPSRRAAVLATFFKSAGGTAFIEDGTACVEVAIGDQMSRSLLGGYSLDELGQLATEGDVEQQQMATDIAARGAEYLRTFDGLMLLEMPPMVGGAGDDVECVPATQLGNDDDGVAVGSVRYQGLQASGGGELPVLLRLKALDTPEDLERVYSRLID